MKRNGRTGKQIGLALVAAGSVIILVLILPGWARWFLLGLSLVVGGICIMRG